MKHSNVSPVVQARRAGCDAGSGRCSFGPRARRWAAWVLAACSPRPPGQNSEKEEGPAEEAPEENRPSDLEPLASYPEQSRRKMQIFEIDGYIRLRSDFMHDFFLGLGYSNIPSGSQIPSQTLRAAAVPGAARLSGAYDGHHARRPLGDAEPRSELRAEEHRRRQPAPAPAAHPERHRPGARARPDRRARQHHPGLDARLAGRHPGLQHAASRVDRQPRGLADVAAWGGTFRIPVHHPRPPEIGQNGFTSSIRAKRAWAEIDTEFGSIRFGRMPWHWGRGMFYNDGNCADCDVGTTVDRVMGLTTIYGHQLAAAWDLGAQGMTTQQLSLGRLDPSGYPYDLSQNDDVLQLMGSITRIDNPITLRERIDRGDVVANYGLQVVYREQGKIGVPPATNTNLTNTQNYGPPGAGSGPAPRARRLRRLERHPRLVVQAVLQVVHAGGRGDRHPRANPAPGRAGGRRQAADAGAGRLGRGQRAAAVPRRVLRRVRGGWRDGRPGLGPRAVPELPVAIRAAADRRPRHQRLPFLARLPRRRNLFRHIMGTVTNATYIKPQAAYWFDLGRTRAVGVNGGAIFSMAQVPVSTPGDSLMYGVETNLGLGYRNTAEGFYAGFVGRLLAAGRAGPTGAPVERHGRGQRQRRPNRPRQFRREVLGPSDADGGDRSAEQSPPP